MKRFYGFIMRLEMYIAQYTLAVLTFLVFASAVARTLHYPISWAIDAATFLFAWCVFFSGDIAMRNDKLVCIDVLTCRLPIKVQRYLRVINYIIIALFLIALIGYGIVLSYTTRLRAFQGIAGFSYTWVTLSVPIGCTLMLITAIRKIKEQFAAISAGAMQKENPVTELI